MERREESARRLRVTVLSRDPVLGIRVGSLRAASVEAVQVDSAYEAAAEILAAPVAALVIDFRAAAAPGAALLGVARQMDVPMLGVGAVPTGLTIDDLSGLRLISRAELPAELERIAAAAQAPARDPGVYLPADGPGAEPAEPPEPKAAPAGRKRASRARKKPRKGTSAAKGARAAGKARKPSAGKGSGSQRGPASGSRRAGPPEAPAETPVPAPAETPPPQAPRAPRDLLTPEELEALLENEP